MNDSKLFKLPLKENVIEMFIGPFGSALKNECFVEKDQGFCIVYEQKHAIQKSLDVDARYVDEKKYKELQRFNVLPGDIIMSCRGTIGEMFIIPNGAPMGIMHPSIMKIRLRQSIYYNEFFVFCLEKFMQENKTKANGSSVKMAVTAKSLGEELFIVPPLELQNKFSHFVEQTEKIKSKIKQSLEKLELLKQSLLQKYFG